MLARANTLADAVRTQSRNVATEEGDQRFHVVADVSEVNQLAADLAATNRSIASARSAAPSAGTLLDKRDQLALRLSELTGGVATQRTDGGFDVTVGGVALVSGSAAGTFDVATGITADGSSDGNPVTFSITSPAGATTRCPQRAARPARRHRRAAQRHPAGVPRRPRSSRQHARRRDERAARCGLRRRRRAPARDCSTTTRWTRRARSRSLITEPGDVASSSLGGGVIQGENATAMANRISVADDYQRLVNGFGSEVASVKRLAANQQTLTGQVDASRDQLAGVNLDEEMVNMLQAQRAYEAASRVISTLDSVLDTLINRTGLVR